MAAPNLIIISSKQDQRWRLNILKLGISSIRLGNLHVQPLNRGQEFSFSVIQLAQTTMRSEVGKITLNKIFEERDTPNGNIVRLSDNDLGVMGATLCPLSDLITVDVNSYKDLVVSFVNILKQVVERRLPKSYDYHQMPAPFIQEMKLPIQEKLRSLKL